MRLFTTFFLVLPVFSSVYAQQDTTTWFDFWVGQWEVSWDEGEGKTGEGTNRIEKILDGKVLQEHFEARKGQMAGFKGTSISVYTPQQKLWHQAWADNQGGYFDFYGEMSGEKRIFRTKTLERNDQKIIQRMVFYDIHPDSFTWDWELSRDDGRNWELRWRINYRRID